MVFVLRMRVGKPMQLRTGIVQHPQLKPNFKLKQGYSNQRGAILSTLFYG